MKETWKKPIKYGLAILGIIALSVVAGSIIGVVLLLGIDAIFGSHSIWVSRILGFIIGFFGATLLFKIFNPGRILYGR